MCAVWLTDVIGVVKATEDVRSLTSKQGKELKKRDLHLVDESQVQIRLTLWANDVSHCFVYTNGNNFILSLKVKGLDIYILLLKEQTKSH